MKPLWEKLPCEMQQNGEINGKFRIINPIYDNKNFAEDPLEIHRKTCNDKSYISEESVDTASVNFNNDNYSATDKSFNPLMPDGNKKVTHT